MPRLRNPQTRVFPTMSYLFYDFETFNQNPKGGRASQFASIRANSDLEIIDGESLNLFCEQTIDNIPSPTAARITGITPQKIQRLKEGVEKPPASNIKFKFQVRNEYNFIGIILHEMSKPNTCILGYNNYSFDDEYTRNLAYRNLYDPYKHEYDSGNSRFDVYYLVLATYVLRPDLLIFPPDVDKETGETIISSKSGKPLPSFRLELLSPANGITHDNAHDAFSDVEATIDIMKIIKEGDCEFFSQIFSLRKTQYAKDWLYNMMASQKPFAHISSFYGKENHCVSIVMVIDIHPNFKNSFICLDLSKDAKSLTSLDSDELKRRLYLTNDQLTAEQIERPGIITIKANQCPVVADIKQLTGRFDTLELDKTTLRTNLDFYRENSDTIKHNILPVFSEPFQNEDLDSDLMIYAGGFFEGIDKVIMNKFHDLAISPNLLRMHDGTNATSRLREMIFKVKARNFPNSLNEDEKEKWKEYSRNRIIDKSVGAELTIQEFYQELQQERKACSNADDKLVLDEIEEYVNKLKNIHNVQ